MIKIWFKTHGELLIQSSKRVRKLGRFCTLSKTKQVFNIKIIIVRLHHQQTIQIDINCNHSVCKKLHKKYVKSFFISFFLFFYFYLYIYPPDSQKATKVLIHRVSNYPDLLSEMPRYCCLLVI